MGHPARRPERVTGDWAATRESVGGRCMIERTIPSRWLRNRISPAVATLEA